MVSCRDVNDYSNFSTNCTSCHGLPTPMHLFYHKKTISFELQINKNLLVFWNRERCYSFCTMSSNIWIACRFYSNYCINDSDDNNNSRVFILKIVCKMDRNGWLITRIRPSKLPKNDGLANSKNREYFKLLQHRFRLLILEPASKWQWRECIDNKENGAILE